MSEDEFQGTLAISMQKTVPVPLIPETYTQVNINNRVSKDLMHKDIKNKTELIPNKKKLGLMIPNLQSNFSDCDPCSPHLSVNQEFEYPADDANEEYHTFSK